MQTDPTQKSVNTDTDLKASAFKSRTGLLPLFGPNGRGGPGTCEDGPCPHVFELPNGDIRVVGTSVARADAEISKAGPTESAVDIPREFFERLLRGMKDHPTFGS